MKNTSKSIGTGNKPQQALADINAKIAELQQQRVGLAQPLKDRYAEIAKELESGVVSRSHGGDSRLACISIRNTENGTLHPLATPAPFWYHPGPTLAPFASPAIAPEQVTN